MWPDAERILIVQIANSLLERTYSYWTVLLTSLSLSYILVSVAMIQWKYPGCDELPMRVAKREIQNCVRGALVRDYREWLHVIRPLKERGNQKSLTFRKTFQPQVHEPKLRSHPQSPIMIAMHRIIYYPQCLSVYL